MSRKIDLTKPLTEDEVQYLTDRDRYYDLEMNSEYVAEAERQAEADRKTKTKPPSSSPEKK